MYARIELDRGSSMYSTQTIPGLNVYWLYPLERGFTGHSTTLLRSAEGGELLTV